MSSVIDICNIALNNIGDAKISSLSEDNQRARSCNLRYKDVRDAVLRSHPWNCVLKRTQIAAALVSPPWGYSYSYPLPYDFLRLIQVKESEYTYSLESGAILTDASSPLHILYVYRNEDTTTYDALLVQAIGLRLAYEIAAELTGKTELKQEMFGRFQQVLQEARGVDATESTPLGIYSDELSGSRFHPSGWAQFNNLPSGGYLR